MTHVDHHVMSLGLLAYAAEADRLGKFKTAARLRREAQAHMTLSSGADAPLEASHMPALGGTS